MEQTPDELVSEKRNWLTIQVFVYLQVLDLLTTLAGLKAGAGEASPFIRLLMQFGPAVGVCLSKVLALALGATCMLLNRHRLLRWISYWYAALVVWNLIMIVTTRG
jgi:hypothetical protein